MTDGEFLKELFQDMVKLTHVRPTNGEREALRQSINSRAEKLPLMFQTPQILQVTDYPEPADTGPRHEDLPLTGADTEIDQDTATG